MRSCLELLTVTLLAISVGRCLAIICYKCDSVNLPSCATSLDSNSLPTEECKNAYSCAMTIVDSVTYRGCISNTPLGSVYYKSCSENLCNKGVYPPGRLKCHHCNGTSCIQPPTEKPTPCLYFFEEDYCYTDVIDETEAFRGCESDTDRIPNDDAEYCGINGCNDLPGVTTLTCAKCDSANGRGCKMDLFEIYSDACNITLEATCSVKSLLGHAEETCFLYHNLDRVVRGCSFDSGELSLDTDHFSTCDQDLCNKGCIQRRKCIACNSTTDARCASDPTALTTVTCESAEASSCNACKMADGSVTRGCGVPSLASGAKCYQCEDEGCNTVPFRECFKCSSAESPNCAQWLNPSAIPVETCEVASADCISALDGNGNTLRGCKGPQLSCNKTLPLCVGCGGSVCNEGVFPPMRLQCFHCDGRGECNDLTDPKNLKTCAQYTKDDACFEFSTPRGVVRGCKSDPTMYYECLLAGAKCKLCSESGCNNNPASRSPSLWCHKCSREDEACGWQQSNETIEACEHSIALNDVERCFIRRYADGSTSRGCSLDDEEDSESEEVNFLAQTCTAGGCNNKTTTIQSCKQCRGNWTTENICTTEISKSESVLCKTANLTFERRGCYSWIDGDFIQRGCAVDLEIEDLSKCKDANDCRYCTGMDCNTATDLSVPNSKGGGTKFRLNLVGFMVLATVWMMM